METIPIDGRADIEELSLIHSLRISSSTGPTRGAPFPLVFRIYRCNRMTRPDQAWAQLGLCGPEAEPVDWGTGEVDRGARYHDSTQLSRESDRFLRCEKSVSRAIQVTWKGSQLQQSRVPAV